MSRPTGSYLKVHYELRPAKQVERHMLVDAFQLLAASGFPIRDYKYTGMGSVYFVDFMLLHRALGITRMLSVEYDKRAAKRLGFNKPYAFIDTRICPIGDVIPDLDPGLEHILWLDYDDVLQPSHLEDAALAAGHLPAGSILLVTVDTEPPEADATGSDRVGGAPCESGPREWRAYFESVAGVYVGRGRPMAHFARGRLPAVNARAVLGAIRAGLVGRPGVGFMQLFCFEYADGHRMLTVGGMVAGAAEERRVRKSGLARAPDVRRDLRRGPYPIRVPCITRKEKSYLDSHMPCADGWKPAACGLSTEDAQAYREVYRFYPSYAELLL